MGPREAEGARRLPSAPTALGRHPPWRLAGYSVWRVVAGVVLVILFLTLVFYAVEVVPGDPSRVLLPRGCFGNPRCPGNTTAQWGLDKPLFDRYAIFLANILTGNLGVSLSIRPGVPVWTLIASALPPTLVLLGVVVLLLAVLAIPLGGGLGRRKGGLVDAIASSLLAIPFALPAAMLSLIAVYYLAVVVHAFPLIVPSMPGQNPSLADLLWAYVLPMLVLLGANLGLYAWVVRDHPLRPPDELGAPAPGEWRTPRKPMARRVGTGIARFLAAIPILFPWTLADVLFAEVIFNINGVGLLFWNGIVRVDVFVAMGVVVVLGIVVVLPVLLVADVLHYAATIRWDRLDRVRAIRFQVRLRDGLQTLGKTVLSVQGMVGIALIVALAVMTEAASGLVGPYPTPFTLTRPFLPPSLQHPLGTDELGRDALTLLVYGGQTEMAAAFTAFVAALDVGLALVAGVGFLGERSRAFLVIPVDLFLILSLPFALLLGAIAGRDSVIWIPALVSWPLPARLLLLETSDMVPTSAAGVRTRIPGGERAARSLRMVLGTSPLIVASALLATTLSVLTETTLELFGLGLYGPGSVVGWGQMVSGAFNNLAVLRGYWWLFVPPILCILGLAMGPALVSLRLKRVGPIGGRAPTFVEIPPPVFVEGSEASRTDD